MAAAASFSSATIPLGKHDVFLSFRGEDTRKSFTSHLYDALDRIQIQTYIDYKLERGDLIAPALLEAITESKLSVIVFSKNYASSSWCLDELVQILKCRASQFVIPIFYDVDPSDIRKQLGSYADAFVEHEKRFEDYKLKAWREALTTAGSISGFDSNSGKISSEAELVNLVVNDVLAKLNRKLHIESGFEGKVGIEKHVQKVESLLCLDAHDVQTVGIWGMGGIGKTTIADVLFHRLSSKFEACCFIQNVREASETRQGLHEMRDRLLRTLLKEENLHVATPSIGPTFVRRRLSCTKALVVLDDVNDLNQVEFLVGGKSGDRILFGPGSRIIVTSRNKRMLGVDEVKIYRVKELNCDEALDLFHLRALGNLSPTTAYTSLSREVVHYAGGNPLALTVLGSVFSHCKSKEDWKGELDKLKRFPDKKIHNVLRFSFDGLEKNEENIFLDIACCHKGKHIDEAKRILGACGFSANAGVRLLIDMSLIYVDEASKLQMHDLIQEMGRRIVFDKCANNPGKRSRLWLANEIRAVLKNNRGTEAIECIAMNTDDLITNLHVNVASFEEMHNLRYLDIHSHSYNSFNKVHLPPRFEFLPEALKYMRWEFYPLPSLPSRFFSEELVELYMPESRLVQLWNKDMQIDLGSLKCIDLIGSKHLAELPDLSGSPNLESIDLEGCSSLVQLPSSIQHNAKLTHLWLKGCSSLKILPQMPGNLELLHLRGTAIEELPSSIWSLEKLQKLGLRSCEKLKNLPSRTCMLNSLVSLRLDGCASLESLPVDLPSGLKLLHLVDCDSLKSLPVELPARLDTLVLRDCKSVRSLPAGPPSKLTSLWLEDSWHLVALPFELPAGLTLLSLRHCKSLAFLPVELPAGLEHLYLNGCKNLGSLPVEFPAGLRSLHLRGCENLVSLPKLPCLLDTLDASDCTSLEMVMPVQGWGQSFFEKIMLNGEEIYFKNCLKLDQTARSNIIADAQSRFIRLATSSCLLNRPRGVTVLFPGYEIPKWLRYQSEGYSINIKLPSHSFRHGFLGYALCIVFEFNNVLPQDLFSRIPPDSDLVLLGCQTHHKINNSHLDFSSTVTMHRAENYEDLPNSDHVLVWYFLPIYVRSESAISSEDWVRASEVSFDFVLYLTWSGRVDYPLDLSAVRLKRCGVSLLYALDSEPDGSGPAILKK